MVGLSVFKGWAAFLHKLHPRFDFRAWFLRAQNLANWWSCHSVNPTEKFTWRLALDPGWPALIHHPIGYREARVWNGTWEFPKGSDILGDKATPGYYIFLPEEWWWPLSWGGGSDGWGRLHSTQSHTSGGLPCKWFIAIISRVGSWGGGHQLLDRNR